MGNNKTIDGVPRELLEQALSGEKVRPLLEGRNNTCVGCGNWMPYGHQEAHEHEDGCPEEDAAKRRHWTSQLRALLANQATCAKSQVAPSVEPLASPKTRYVRVPSREDPKYNVEWPEIEGGRVFEGRVYCTHLFEVLKRERITLVETLPVEAVDE